MDYPESLYTVGFIYFGGIFIFVIITSIMAMRWYAREARYHRARADEAYREREEKPADKPKPARKPVVFVDAEEDEEEEFEAPKPAGKHIYDPKQHKVVWVPAEGN
jgi:hypothetical protein